MKILVYLVVALISQEAIVNCFSFPYNNTKKLKTSTTQFQTQPQVLKSVPKVALAPSTD